MAYQQLGQWSQAKQAVAQSLNLLKTEQNMGTSKELLQILAQTLDIQGRLQLVQGQSVPISLLDQALERLSKEANSRVAAWEAQQVIAANHRLVR